MTLRDAMTEKVPKGFENFFPKNKRDKEGADKEAQVSSWPVLRFWCVVVCFPRTNDEV